MSRPIRAHTGLFRQMQMLIKLARLKDTNPKAYDRAMEGLIGGRESEVDESRRSFLKNSAGVAAGALGLEMLESAYKQAYAQGGGPTKKLKVAIVGAGVAGLNCAWQLRKFAKAGLLRGFDLEVTIYEGRPNRTGGRMFTSIGDVAQGMHCELGAEFVDSSNDDIFALAQDPELGAVCLRHFNHKLAILDCGQDARAPGGDPSKSLIAQHLFVRGEHHTIEEAVEAMKPYVARAVPEMDRINKECADIRRTSNSATSCGGTGSLGFNNFGIPSGVLDRAPNTNILKFDRMSVRKYFDEFLGIPKEDWLHGYMEAAYTTEYGIPLELQSALSAVTLLGEQEDTTNSGHLSRKKGVQVDVFGPSDERFKVIGGNDKIVRCLTIAIMEASKKDARFEPVRFDIKLGHKLVKASRQDEKVEKLRSASEAPKRNAAREAKYTLNFENGKTITDVDLVVLACPLTMLSTTTLDDYVRNQHPRYRDPQRLREDWPRFARMHPSEPDYQPTFTVPADLSALGIQRGTPERPSKAEVIDRVGYGRNMKVMAGFDQPVWRQQKPTAQSNGRYGGYTFSDRPFQMGWDSGQCQDLPSLPTAVQVKKGTLPNGMPNNEVVETAAQPNHLIARGRQFSWFLGGGISPEQLKSGHTQNFGEQILSDPALRGFVTHSVDNRFDPREKDDVIRAAKGFSGDGATNPKYQGTGNAQWNQQYLAMAGWINKIVSDTGSAYDGFVESFTRQTGQRTAQTPFALGRHASTSMIWTNDPFTKASYLAYRVGQWSTMSGMEGAPLGFDGRIAPESECSKWTLFFAGEHCSSEFQGFMNGGAQTGRLAAQRLLMSLIGSEAARKGSPTELAQLLLPNRRSIFVTGLDKIFG